MPQNGEWHRVRGVVFDIQHYSIHDGPGIRTTVFLKGCPLGCWWCQNPEARSPAPELLFDTRKCAGCGACAAACPNGAITRHDGRSHTERNRCNTSGQCVVACRNEARTIAGRLVTAGEVMEEALADAMFYADSGGGITISGGDPLAQPDFSVALLQLARAEGFHTTVDTCGYAPWLTARPVFELADLILYDIKHLDRAVHEQATGVSNELILDNARRLHRELNVPLRVRVPVIPGFNDSPKSIEAIAGFVLQELGKSTPVDLLAYHRLGSGKRELLEIPHDNGPAPPPPEHMERLRALVAAFGLEAKIGG